MWTSRRLAGLLAALLAVPLGIRAETPAHLLTPERLGFVVEALAELNLTTNDLGFEKDYGEPLFALPAVRRLLAAPLDLPGFADQLHEAARNPEAAALWNSLRDVLDGSSTTNSAGPLGGSIAPSALPAIPTNLDPALRAALDAFLAESVPAAGLADRAVSGIPEEDARCAAARVLAATLSADVDPGARSAAAAAGLGEAAVDTAIRESDALDPAPSATRYLAVVRRLSIADLAAAAQRLRRALAALHVSSASIVSWPSSPVRLTTPAGDVIVGTPGADVYTNAALLIIEPGGNDRYLAAAGTVNGLAGRRLGALLDLSGDDTYTSDEALGAGSAVFGVVVLVDVLGNDTYRTDYAGQAAAVFGAAWVEDQAGRDVYQAGVFAQAAAEAGLALLLDAEGNDLYDVGLEGQAMAGVRAAAALVDRQGNDRYLAGGRRPDFDRHGSRYLALSQGFSIGQRPFAGGGVAVLADLGGNDSYEADVFGQGASYWYSAGFLFDDAGDDDYRVYEYGQGAGIHLSVGLLADRAGNDQYTAFSLAQGSAHDYAVGMLFDEAGNDRYAAFHQAQARSLNNSVALLMDQGGTDTYLTRDLNGTQAVGDDGGPREYGGIALLFDLGGEDSFTCGARDGARRLRPNHGVLHDRRD